jgi:hypothetical protein
MLTVQEMIVRPQAGMETEAIQTLEEVKKAVAQEWGYVEGYVQDGLAEGGLVGLVTVWQDSGSAQRAGTLDVVVALREKLEGLAEANGLAPILDVVSQRMAGEPVSA